MDALPVTEEAAAIRRELAPPTRTVPPDLAGSLANLGAPLSELGRDGKATAISSAADRHGGNRVCLPGSHRKGGSAPVTRTRVRRFRAAGCDHPVLPLDAAVDAMLTGENPQTARQHTVESVGIVLLPRRDASGQQ